MGGAKDISKFQSKQNQKIIITSNSIRNLRHLLTHDGTHVLPGPLSPLAEAANGDSGEAQLLEDTKTKLGEVDPSRRGIISIIRETRANISAHIKLVTTDPAAYADGEAGFVRACAQEKGPADSVTPQVAILFDVKNSGEASHRPALRCRRSQTKDMAPKSRWSWRDSVLRSQTLRQHQTFSW